MFKFILHIVILFTPLFVICQNVQTKKFFTVDSTQLSEVYHYEISDSSLNGSYESFYRSGSLQVYGWYKNNRPDSIWTYYYENGKKKALGRFKEGIPNGKWEYFFENGNIKSTGTLRDDVKNGGWVFYFENGGEKSSGDFQKNQKIGIWNYFYEDQTIKAQAFYSGQIATYKEFYPFGNVRMEGKISNDKSIGEWIYYFETGEVEAVGQFSDGLRSGEWQYFHKNGEKRAAGNYKNGLRVGEWKYYHENGTLHQSGLLEQDRKQGYWKLFYPTGEVKGEVSFNKGSGSFSEYYTNGGKKASGQLVDDKKEGKWVYYAEDGRIEGEANFKNGEGNYQGYYPDGTLKMEGQIKDDKRINEWTLYNPDGSLAGTYFPIYENEKPIFKTRQSRDFVKNDNTGFDKPEYTFKRRGLRYFQYRINEYQAIILGTNPVWLLDSQLPIAIEYYKQERLGYELQLDLMRNPFFVSDDNIENDVLFERGSKINFRQKFYHEDGRFGMFYFGHQLSYSKLNFKVNYLDQTIIFPGPQLEFGKMVESGFSYGILVGSRWMRDVGDSGWTIDVFLGLNVASRSYERDNSDPIFDNFFDPKIKSSLHFPITFGLNFGFAGPDSKSKTQ
ncbi:MAG: toxin-antitoxin system YwqK family antitoxin [Cyclobacteriaceae bacterium]